MNILTYCSQKWSLQHACQLNVVVYTFQSVSCWSARKIRQLQEKKPKMQTKASVGCCSWLDPTTRSASYNRLAVGLQMPCSATRILLPASATLLSSVSCCQGYTKLKRKVTEKKALTKNLSTTICQ